MMKCSGCGCEIPDGAELCPECGAPVPARKKRKPLWILPIAVFVLLCGCGAWLLLRHPPKGSVTVSPSGEAAAASAGDSAPAEEPDASRSGPRTPDASGRPDTELAVPDASRPGGQTPAASEPVVPGASELGPGTEPTVPGTSELPSDQRGHRYTTVFDCRAPEEELEYVPEPQERLAGDPVEIPPYPVRDGYVFGGWCTDAAGTEPFDFRAPPAGDLTLYARWIDEDDDEARLTEEEWNTFLAASEEFIRRTAEWFDENGFVAPENRKQALNTAEAYAAELKEEGTVTYYSRTEELVYVEFASMIPYIFYPFTQGFDGSGEGVIVAVDPLANEKFKDSEEKRGEFCKEIAEEICETMRITESNHYLNGGADYIELQEIPNCEVFLWHGHGIYLNELHSVLVTGDTYSEWEYFDLYLKLNMSEGGKIRGKTFCGINDNRIGVTGEYFRLYTDFSLAHGLVYLAACHSLDDDYLLRSFTGAEVVFGNEESIYTSYDQIMMRLILRYMCGKGVLITDGRLTSEIDPVVYTAEKALEKAHEYQRSLLEAHGAEYDGHDYWIKRQLADDQWEIESGNATVKCFGYTKSEYTLVPGIKGSLVTPDGSFNPEAIQVILSNGQTGAAYTHVSDESGNPMFYINNVEPGTYRVEIRYFDVLLWSKENVQVVRHRYTDLGLAELPLCTVTGRVLDAETREPVGADFDGTAWLPADVSAVEGGRFEIVFPKGSWTLQINPFDHVRTSVSFEVPEGADALDLGDILVNKEAPAMIGPVVSDGTACYFWKYTADSHEDGYLFAEFPAVAEVENQLICWKDGQETELLTAPGEGTLCLAGGRIWFERVEPGQYTPRTVCSAAMDGSDYRSLEKGWLKGVSSDGQYLLIQQYDENQSRTYQVQTGTWTTLPEGSNAILTVYKDRIYYWKAGRNGELTVSSVNFDGTDDTELTTVYWSSYYGDGWVGNLYPGEIRFPSYNGTEYIMLSFGSIVGSGGTFDAIGFTFARIGGPGNHELNIVLPEATSADFTVDEATFTPTCCGGARISESFYTAVHWWYTANSRIGLINPANGVGTEVVSSDELPAFFDGAGALGEIRNNKIWRVVEVQKIGDRVFFRAEQSHRDESYDLGWQEGYAFEKGALFVKDLNTGEVEIVYTYGDSVDVKIQRQDIYYDSPEAGCQIPLHYDLVTVQGDTEAIKRINETIQADFYQFRIAGNQDPVDQEHVNRDRHGWMYLYLNDKNAKEYVDYPGIFPGTVTAEVTCNKDGLLSIRYDAVYYFDYHCIYGMTFDVRTGEMLTVPELYPDRLDQIREMLRSGTGFAESVRGSLNSDDVLAELANDPDLSRMDFYLNKRELVLISPRLLSGDGTVRTVQIPFGTGG